jgi:hypothetical protein
VIGKPDEDGSLVAQPDGTAVVAAKLAASHADDVVPVTQKSYVPDWVSPSTGSPGEVISTRPRQSLDRLLKPARTVGCPAAELSLITW